MDFNLLVAGGDKAIDQAHGGGSRLLKRICFSTTTARQGLF
jgi:hypothetical protein